MRPMMTLLTLFAALALAGCVEPEDDTYPLSGEQCTAEDPVQDFGATDCTPIAGTGVGGM